LMPSAASYPVLGDFPCFSHKNMQSHSRWEFRSIGSLLKKTGWKYWNRTKTSKWQHVNRYWWW